MTFVVNWPYINIIDPKEHFRGAVRDGLLSAYIKGHSMLVQTEC